jgi:hypothetical protein
MALPCSCYSRLRHYACFIRTGGETLILVLAYSMAFSPSLIVSQTSADLKLSAPSRYLVNFPSQLFHFIFSPNLFNGVHS